MGTGDSVARNLDTGIEGRALGIGVRRVGRGVIEWLTGNWITGRADGGFFPHLLQVKPRVLWVHIGNKEVAPLEEVSGLRYFWNFGRGLFGWLHWGWRLHHHLWSHCRHLGNPHDGVGRILVAELDQAIVDLVGGDGEMAQLLHKRGCCISSGAHRPSGGKLGREGRRSFEGSGGGASFDFFKGFPHFALFRDLGPRGRLARSGGLGSNGGFCGASGKRFFEDDFQGASHGGSSSFKGSNSGPLYCAAYPALESVSEAVIFGIFRHRLNNKSGR